MAEAIRGDVEAAGYELEVITFDDVFNQCCTGRRNIDVNGFNISHI